MIGNFGLPCWLTATGLRVSVTRLNWGMFGSFLSVFFKSSLGPPRNTMVRRFAGWSYWEGQVKRMKGMDHLKGLLPFGQIGCNGQSRASRWLNALS